MKTEMSLVVRFGLVAMLGASLAAMGCGDDTGPGGSGGTGGGTGGSGGVAGTGGGGTGGGGTGGGGTGGVGGVLDLADPDTLAALVDAGLPLIAEITDVTIESPPVMTFAISTQAGNPVTGVPASAVTATLVKLEPPVIVNGGTPDERAQQTSRWESYINVLATPGGAGDPTLPQAQQASRDPGAVTVEDGEDIINVTDNGDGTYVFNYTTDPTDVTSPVPVSWEPTYTTRAGVEIRLSGAGALNPDNPTYDFVPDGDPVTVEKSIAATATCNDCHQRLALHGGGRFAEGYCVTCHNDGTRDPDNGESVSMAYMAHSIHASALRDDQGAPYVVVGFRGTVHDYSEVTYPQDVRECTNCHQESAETPQGGDWSTTVNSLACGGCHVDTDVVALVVDPPDETTGLSTYRMEHKLISQTFNDGACRNCHNNDTFDPPIDTVGRHVIPELLVAGDFQYNIIEATDTDVGELPQITFSVTNPNDGDSAYDLAEDGGPFDTATWGGDARLAVMLAWPSIDYSNIDTGSEVAGFRPGSPAQNVSLDPLSACVPPSGSCTDNGDGTYTITSSVAVPAGLTGGSLAVAMEGHPFAVVNPVTDERAEIPVTGAVSYFAISETGGAGEPRELGVSLERCADCHGSLLSLHGSNRTNNLELCVTCHNANATDIRARAEAGIPGETSIDFKTMIHGIHAANVVIYGFGGSEHDYTEVTYPGALSNCAACHVGQTYYPTDPDTQPRFATTFISDNFTDADFPDEVVSTEPRTPEREDTLANQTDDLNRTSNAAASMQCHTGATAASHVVIPGGAKLSVKQDNDGSLQPTPGDPNPGAVETCILCHGQGSTVCDGCDVAVGHMPWFPLP
ncbi:MAG: OmcA/MtrC family decaheme c-type cytochrome [Polyangiales bacterium]